MRPRRCSIIIYSSYLKNHEKDMETFSSLMLSQLNKVYCNALERAQEGLTISQVLVGGGFLFLLINAKGIPGIWHVRLFKGLIVHLGFGRSRTPAAMLNASGYPRLFSYLVTSCSTPLIDCDYNMHKSNSTFFSDADINRTQLMCSLFKHVLSQSSLIDYPEKRKRPLIMALGGTSCIFKREIEPLQRFEVWSRVSAWDEKWVYVVSYFVATKPSGKKGKSVQNEKHVDSPPNSRILASCIARYVFKDGRVTMRPEMILRECGLIPKEALESSKEGENNTRWSDARFNEERLKGLEVASKFTELEVLPSFFNSREEAVLGSYTDL